MTDEGLLVSRVAETAAEFRSRDRERADESSSCGKEPQRMMSNTELSISKKQD
jgi:hypothetical protein